MKNISRLAVFALFLAALPCALPHESRAATYRPAAVTVPAGSVPNTINYQGRLIDNGFPVNATRTISFRIYDSAAGGTLLYTVAPQQVVVSQGIFGTTLAISTMALAGTPQKYLEVQIDNTTLTPREPLNSVPYALVAKSLEDNLAISTVTVGSQFISSGTLAAASLQALNGSSYFSILSPVHMSSATLTIDGNATTALTTVGNVGVGITGTAPNAQLQVANPLAGAAFSDVIVGNGSSAGGNNTQAAFYRGGAAGSYVGLDAYNAGIGGTVLLLNGRNNGPVGIGVGALPPGAKLDVDGNAQFGAAGTKSVFSPLGALTLANSAGLAMSAANLTLAGPGSFVGVGTPNPATKIHMSSGTLTIDGNTATSIVTAGQVGIGGAPSNPLSVVGNANVTGTLTAGSFSGPITGNAATATSLAGGAANQVPYQTGAGATTFVGAPGANMVFSGNSAAPFWTNTPIFTGTNISGTAAVLNIGGNAATVTTNANLTGNVTSVGNATTIAVIPAVSGAALTSLTPGNISAGTAGISITGNAATVTTNANLTGNVTSVGNATTIAVIPAVSGAALTALTPGNISAGTAGISITGNAATAQAANGGVSHSSFNKAALSAILPAIGQIFFCNNCVPPKIVVATGTAAGNFADPMGGPFQ